MPNIDMFLENGFIPFYKEIKWTLKRRKDYFSGEKKLIFKFTKKQKFTDKEKGEILLTAYKLGLKHKKNFRNKTPKLILPGIIESNNIYIEYY